MTLEIIGRTINGHKLTKTFFNVGENGGIGIDGSAFNLRHCSRFFAAGYGNAVTFYYNGTSRTMCSGAKSGFYAIGSIDDRSLYLMHGGDNAYLSPTLFTVTLDDSSKVYFGVSGWIGSLMVEQNG